MDEAAARNHYAFHRHALLGFLNDGGRMNVYRHEGYVCAVRNIAQYYRASMDMLNAEIRHQIFPASRPVRTKIHEEVSSYFGESAVVKNSLVADNCIIEGSLENCIVFTGVHVGKGAVLKNCIIMKDGVVGNDTHLDYVIADKDVTFSSNLAITGTQRLPIVVPKGSEV
jgi:glucose-1-phosphate adenylyltransferase